MKKRNTIILTLITAIGILILSLDLLDIISNKFVVATGYLLIALSLITLLVQSQKAKKERIRS